MTDDKKKVEDGDVCEVPVSHDDDGCEHSDAVGKYDKKKPTVVPDDGKGGKPKKTDNFSFQP